MEDVLTPFKACAKYVGMKYLEPLVFFTVAQVDEKAHKQPGKVFSGRLHE